MGVRRRILDRTGSPANGQYYYAGLMLMGAVTVVLGARLRVDTADRAGMTA
jgi:hypothetical protein